MARQSTQRKRPTQADVARVANVSQTTVSLVLNNEAAPSVPAETRQRVLDAIVQIGYVPDRMARSLRTRKTYTIAGVIPDITNPFYPAFERGIQDVAESRDYDLITYNTDGRADKEQKLLRWLQQGRVDGVIAVLFHLRAPDLVPILDMNIAVVRLLAAQPNLGELPIDNLFLDNRAAACAAVGYLIECGHTRIGMIAGALGPREARVQGYRQALEQHGLPIDETLIRDGDFTETTGYSRAKELLALHPRPTAVFAANDLMALGAMVSMREAGLRVPEDVAVVGFDNIPAARLAYPTLTTVAQHPEQMGQRAAEMLLERINGQAPPHARREEMPFELIIRESTQQKVAF